MATGTLMRTGGFFLCLCSQVQLSHTRKLALCLGIKTRGLIREGPNSGNPAKRNGDAYMALESKEQQFCEVHGTALQPGLASIAYGLFRVDKAYLEDMQDLFPRANSWVGGGCVSNEINVAEVDFCLECREAEIVWR